MILVTGGAGFIGSNLIRALNRRGRSDLFLIEDLTDGTKALNIADCVIGDYLDRERCLSVLESGADLPQAIEVAYHLGACSNTTEWDGRYMMDSNYRFSRALFEYCLKRKIPMVYASSAAVYGNGRAFEEIPANEHPLNVYGYSKLVFDQYVRSRMERLEAPVVGLRYFNVYGPGEAHKNNMASVVWHFYQQWCDSQELRLFEASHGYADGEQKRDFIHVDDAVAVTLWCAEQSASASGIYNCGTGTAASFNEVAKTLLAWAGSGKLSYIPFPPRLNKAYQAFTEADLSRLRALGYSAAFKPVAEGVREYLNWLAS